MRKLSTEMSSMQGKGDHRVPCGILLVLEVRRPKQARMNNVTENHDFFQVGTNLPMFGRGVEIVMRVKT